MPGSHLRRLRRSSRSLGRIDCDLSEQAVGPDLTTEQTQTLPEIVIACDAQPLSVRCSSVCSHFLGLKSRHDVPRQYFECFFSHSSCMSNPFRRQMRTCTQWIIKFLVKRCRAFSLPFSFIFSRSWEIYSALLLSKSTYFATVRPYRNPLWHQHNYRTPELFPLV
jgi:hypothetical protein